MPLITWKDKVRVRVGELTRAGQFDLWRAAEQAGLLDEKNGETEIRWSRAGDDLIGSVATRSIEICDGNGWRPLEAGETYNLPIEDDETVLISHPMKPAYFDSLPASLANPWLKAALDANGGLHDALFFVSSLVTFTTPNSETPPVSESSPTS